MMSSLDVLRTLHEKEGKLLTSELHFQVLRTFPQLPPHRKEDQDLLLYLATHSVNQNGQCVQCLVRRDLTQVDLSNKRIRKLPDVKRIVKARAIILESMEQAYINPIYTWCVRRLRNDCIELNEDTKKFHAKYSHIFK